MAVLTLGLCGWSAVPAAAQVTLTGHVTDSTTGEPLSGVHVFVAESMAGTTTDTTGRFTLSVRPGAAQLYVSMVGYAPADTTLTLHGDTTHTFAFQLAPTVLDAEGVTVTAERDEDWYERVEKFRRLFIGASPRAAQCMLRNPEALRFDSKWWGKFTARAAEPLVVENRALGYKVTYFLKEFESTGTVVRWDGEPLFEELTPRDSSEARRWAENRREAYYGSLRHFLTALLHDRVKAEGFSIYRLPRSDIYRRTGRADRFRTSRDRILEADADSTWELSFRGRLEVIYRGEREREGYLDWARLQRPPRSVQTSQIELNDPPVHVDRYGEIVEPYGATVYAYFSYELRLAEMLPREYVPTDKLAASSLPQP